jgi:hypothetical protein
LRHHGFHGKENDVKKGRKLGRKMRETGKGNGRKYGVL